MQAYAEGFEMMHKSKFPIELKEVAGLWNRGSVVRSWLLRARRARLRAGGQRPRGPRRARLGLRRGPLDDRRRDRPRRADAGDRRVALRALLLARRGRLHAPVLAALRNQFGGHAVQRPAGAEPMAVDTDAPDSEVGENPLVEGLERLPVPPTTLVIFGATGDLAHRKLLPALYNLAHEGALPERFNLIGVARREQTDDDFRDECDASRSSQYSRREPDDEVLDGAARAHALRRRRPFDDTEGYKRARRGARRARRGRRPAARPRSTTSRPRRSSSP